MLLHPWAQEGEGMWKISIVVASLWACVCKMLLSKPYCNVVLSVKDFLSASEDKFALVLLGFYYLVILARLKFKAKCG